MTDAVPVLVTGGAGYIGSHAVLALQDAGWPVAVIDNLVTGFRFAVPEACSFFRATSPTRRCLARIFAEQGIGRDHAFRWIGGGSRIRWKIRSNITSTTRSRPARCLQLRWMRACPHVIFQLDRCDLWHTGRFAGARRYAAPPDQSLWHVEADDRVDARRHRRSPWLNYCALRYFNVAGADPQGRTGQSTAGATHLIKVAVEAALGKRGVSAFSAPTMTHPTAPACAIISMSADLADAHVLALEALIAQPERSLTMNCGYGRGFSVLEVLDAVDRVTNRTIERRMEQRRAGDPDALISDNARIKATLPWQPQHADLDTIVSHALQWERKLGEIRAAT